MIALHRAGIALGLALAAANPVVASEAAPSFAVQSQGEFARFTPTEREAGTTLDWSVWDQALNWFVLNMGPSLRRGAPAPVAYAGSHITWGHDSRYRLEGNKVAFSIIKDRQLSALTEYRLDLERIGSEVSIADLPRNEQLAFWMNLHNVAVIEQLALDYPVMSPKKVKPAGFDVPLDEAKFITVAGVAMSPKDIRTRIVYPNWSDARVIYGFFRGDIGSPSIAKQSFNGRNVAFLLRQNATEFVNALRGVQKRGDTMQVSKIFAEARPFFFPDWEADMRAHIARFAQEDVQSILARTSRVEATIYETDIADLSKGEREPQYGNMARCIQDWRRVPICMDDDPRINPAEWMFAQERRLKIDALVREGKIGTVTVREVEEEEGAEVE